MDKIILNGENMTTRATAHAEIKREMGFPEYYGGNLDALWDMISATSAEVELHNPVPMLNGLGKYGCKLLETFFEAAEDNENFSFRLESDCDVELF